VLPAIGTLRIDKLTTPRVQKLVSGPQRALTVAEARTLLAALGEYRNTTAFHLLLGLRLRRGEVLGLRWADLDWAASTIKVTQQVQLVGQQVVISTPKTERSGRLLPLTARMLARLERKRAAQAAERQEWGEAWKDHGLSFATPY